MKGVWIAALRVSAVALLTLVFAVPAAAAPAASPAAAGGGPAALTVAQSQQTGTIIDFGFDPPTLTVNVGDSVTWTNTGGRPHTVTDRANTFDTDAIVPGASGTVEFTVPGNYFFFCRINPGSMNGVITVQAGAEPSNTNRIQAIDDVREGEQLRFDPPELSVPAGSTIQFGNVGGKPHTLTADDGSFDTGEVAPGQEQGRFAGNAVTFTAPTEPGQYAFRCSVHPEPMQGVLTVVEAAGAPPETAPPPAEGGGETPPPPAEAPAAAEVTMADFSFDAAEVSVAPGGQVTWTNAGQAPHTATFDEVELDTGQLAAGETGALTAPQEAGSYTYFCALHPGQMRGVLVVVPPGTPDPTGAQAAPVAVGAAGPAAAGGSRGLTLGILIAAVLGAFLGGLGLSVFVRGRKRQQPPPPPPSPTGYPTNPMS